MNALVLTATHQPLVLEERPPLQAAPGEVIVRLQAAALNRRDYWIGQGMYPGIEPPVVLGSDGAGVVTSVGAEVEPGWIDREVIINPGLGWGENEAAQDHEFHILGLPRDGTFAEEVAVPASQLHPKPGYLSWEESAGLPLAGVTAYRALFSQGNLHSGERVLITGIGGGVATFALQFALAAKAEVWVTSSSSEKIQRAVDLGARGGYDYRETEWWRKAAAEMKPPHLILDSAGGSSYSALLQLAAPGARIINYGATAGPPKDLDLFKVFWKQLHLIGSTMGSPADFEAMLQFAEQHGIRPLIDAVLPLRDGNEALERMKTSPQFGKYVLTME